MAFEKKEKGKDFLIMAVVIVGVCFLVFGGFKFFFKGSDSTPISGPAPTPTPESTLEPTPEPSENLVAVLETNFGAIRIKLFGKEAPNTVANFEKLAGEGFYDGIKFHRVIKDFMIQTGDPKSRDDDWSDDGTGGPGYKFDDEINSQKLIRGRVAMANSGPNTNGSQFFIVTAESAPWLDGKHTVFGEVIEGMDMVSKIENLPVNENNHPTKDAVMKKVYIEQ